MPDVRTGDTNAPRAFGQYAGIDLLGSRDITITIDIGPPFGSYTNLAGALAALRTALTPTGTTENPLFFQLPSGPSSGAVGATQYVAMVRPRKRTGKIDFAAENGQLMRGVVMQFHATDPTIYAAQTLNPSTNVPPPLGGFSFNLSFPLSFGGGTEAGLIDVTNAGDIPCYPQFIVAGPCTYPTITNTTMASLPFIQFQVIMNTGDTLTINTDPKYRSAIYLAAGTTQGVSRLYTLSSGSAWFALAPGLNAIDFTTLDVTSVAGYLTMNWTSSYSAAA